LYNKRAGAKRERETGERGERIRGAPKRTGKSSEGFPLRPPTRCESRSRVGGPAKKAEKGWEAGIAFVHQPFDADQDATQTGRQADRQTGRQAEGRRRKAEGGQKRRYSVQ